MKLTYYAGDSVGPNFGDQLNCWMWPRLMPDFFDEDDSRLFLGIGTIISQWMPGNAQKLVLGAGTTPEIAPKLDATWKILSVRGPLTARVLGISEDYSVTDPAMLISNFIKRDADTSGPVTLMIHHARSKRGNWKLACALAGINCIDPHDDVDHVIQTLSKSRLVLAEAMHAAIVADALRVPWIPVVIHDHINAFKWSDWCHSMCLDYRPVVLSPLLDGSAALGARIRAKIMPYYLATQLSKVMRTTAPMLSSDTVMAARRDRLLELVEMAKRE